MDEALIMHLDEWMWSIRYFYYSTVLRVRYNESKAVSIKPKKELGSKFQGSHRTCRLRWRSGGRQTDDKETLLGLNERKYCTVSFVAPGVDTVWLCFDLRHQLCFPQWRQNLWLPVLLESGQRHCSSYVFGKWFPPILLSTDSTMGLVWEARETFIDVSRWFVVGIFLPPILFLLKLLLLHVLRAGHLILPRGRSCIDLTCLEFWLSARDRTSFAG